MENKYEYPGTVTMTAEEYMRIMQDREALRRELENYKELFMRKLEEVEALKNGMGRV